MFKLYFNYNGKDIALKNCYGFLFSVGGRRMYVKIKENGHIVTRTYYTKLVENFMISF